MNKDNAHLYLPLVKALAEGKTIQVYTANGWQDSLCVSFLYYPENYRIKPEPREWDVWIDEDGQTILHTRQGQKSGSQPYKGATLVRVREILPE